MSRSTFPSVETARLLLEAPDDHPKVVGAIREAIGHLPDSTICSLRAKVIEPHRERMQQVLAEDEHMKRLQSAQIQSAFQSLNLFPSIQRALLVNLDDNWTGDSFCTMRAYHHGISILDHLVMCGLIDQTYTERFNALFELEDAIKNGDYSVAFKLEFIRIFATAKERALSLYESLGEDIRSQLPPYCVRSETKPVEEYATVAEWMPYIEERYGNEPEFLSACKMAMANEKSGIMSLHQIAGRAKFYIHE